MKQIRYNYMSWIQMKRRKQKRNLFKINTIYANYECNISESMHKVKFASFHPCTYYLDGSWHVKHIKMTSYD